MRKNQENWWPKNYQASEVSDFFQGKTTASSNQTRTGKQHWIKWAGGHCDFNRKRLLV